MTIRIHIGAHKTATTEMQHALRSVRLRLEEAGVSYRGPGGLRGNWIALRRALLHVDSDEHNHAQMRLRSWLGRAQHYLLSEENILGSAHRRQVFGPGNRLYPFAEVSITRLLALMGNPEVELFLAIRDPAEFVTSAYGQVLREGVAMAIEDYVQGYDVAAFSWADLAARLTACPGVTRLVCWRYEDYAALRPRIMSELLGKEAAALVPPMASHNAGISEAAYQQFCTWIMDDVDIELSFVDLLQRARAAHPKKPGEPGMRPLPPEVYANSRMAYPRDVAALQAMKGVTLLLP